MSEHILNLLNAYYDGELGPNQIRKVERHLAECSTCQEAYEDIVSTSSWLHSLPEMETIPAEKTAADIALLLPREQEKPRNQSNSSIIWWIVPMLLFAVWILAGSIHMMSNVLITANQLGFISIDPGLYSSHTINEIVVSTLVDNLNTMVPKDISWMINTQDFLRENAIRSVINISIAMLYLSWLAIWRANQNRQGNGQSLQK